MPPGSPAPPETSSRYYRNWLMSNSMIALGRLTYGSLAMILIIFGTVCLIPGIIIICMQKVDVEDHPHLWYLAVILAAMGAIMLFLCMIVVAAAVYQAWERKQEQLVNEQIEEGQFSSFPPNLVAQVDEAASANTQENHVNGK